MSTDNICGSAVFYFVGGMLTIRLTGFGPKDGSGYFNFDEDDVLQLSHDDREGGYIEVQISRSELLELRDWITVQMKVMEQ